jgi:hypothetical protein
MGWIEGHDDGTFTPMSTMKLGSVWCHFLNVRDAVSYGTEPGPIVEVIAWEDCRPWVWWMLKRHKLTPRVTVLGQWELANAWRERRPARMLATPAEFVRSHGAGFLVVDWSLPREVLDIIGESDLEFSDPWLSNKLVAARLKCSPATDIPTSETFNVAA